MTFDELFDSVRFTAFRLEARQRYNVPAEAERFAAWRKGMPLPERSPETSPWLARVATMTRAGKRWSRVHLVNLPLSDYLRFEFTGQAANVAAGEDIRIAARSAHPALANLEQDFWLLDNTTVILLRYDNHDRFVRWDVSTAPDLLERCLRERDLALAHSIPLAEFQASVAA